MTRLVVLAVVIFCSGAVTLTQEALLSLDAAKIQAGQSVKLKWNIGNADKVFISEVGKFTSDGAQTVTPDKTTTYTLIAEGKFGIVSKTITLVVEGARGDDPNGDGPPTDYKAFKYPLTTKHKGSSFVEFLGLIHHVLQDDMKFSVYGPLPSPSGNFMFVTNFKRKGDLVKPDERTIAERKISHMVEIDRVTSPGQDYTLTIKALVKYRKARESTWRDEGSEEFYRPESEGLKKRIDSLAK